MELMRWILHNFGLFFGPVFLGILFLMLRRLIIIYDVVRHVSRNETISDQGLGGHKGLSFLTPLFSMLSDAASTGKGSMDVIIDAIWSEVEFRLGTHFSAISGYVNTLILIGFAGTITGAIGAFNEMFLGLGAGKPAIDVFISSWNNGLATALYTSLGSATIGGVFISIISSRYFLSRSKRLETLISIRINQIIVTGGTACKEDVLQPQQQACRI